MDWRLIYEVSHDVVLVALFVYTVWSNRAKVTAKRFGNLESRVATLISRDDLQRSSRERDAGCQRHQTRTDRLEESVTRLQSDLEHLPSQADIGRVHARMDEVYGLVKSLDGELKGSRRQLDLVLEELLRRDK